MKVRTVAYREVAVARAARAAAASTMPARQRIDGLIRWANLFVARDAAVPVSAPRARVQPVSVELRPIVFRSRGICRPTAPAVTSAKQKAVTVKIRTAGSRRMKRRPAPTSGGPAGLVAGSARPVRTAAISAAARTSALASAAMANEGPTAATSRPASAGPARNPIDHTAERADWPRVKFSGPTTEATAPKAAASAKTRPDPTTKPAVRTSATGGGPVSAHNGIDALAVAWTA